MNPDPSATVPELSANVANRLRDLAAARRLRRSESLQLYRARPSTLSFHSSKAMINILRGGNRSGKTVAAAAEFASFVTGLPILNRDGQPVSPPRPKGPLRTWVVGYDLKHIGQTIHRVLFKPGLFRIVKDQVTGELRTWRPWEDEDAARVDETMPSPPLIPERFIDPAGWSWEDKAANVFNVCRLINGNEIYAFGSGSEAKQGDTVHRIWIDEDIQYPQHVDEWIMRLPDVNGSLMWSAMPHERNDALIKLSDMAFAQKDREDPDITETQLTFSGNEFIGLKEKVTTLSFLDADARRRRDLGEYNKTGRLVFPAFSDILHGMDLEEWMNRYLEGPQWCRYLAVDPGWARAAATFWAVSPPEVFPQIILLEDELYLEHANAAQFMEAVQVKIRGRCYQSFIIDLHGSRITEMGSGQTVVNQYSNELRRLDVRSVETNFTFEAGCDNKDFRILCARDMLGVGDYQTPAFRFIRQNTPHFQNEIQRYRRKLGPKGEILDEPDDRHWSHLMVTFQYFAAAMNAEGRERYHRPKKRAVIALTPVQQYLLKKREKQRNKRPYVNLGPEEIQRAYEFV